MMLLSAEVAVKDLLKNFLEKYGKVVDMEKEDKRFAIALKEAAVDIVKDYDLPLSPSQFVEEITPMYKERFLSLSLSSTFTTCNLIFIFKLILNFGFVYPKHIKRTKLIMKHKM